MDSVVKKALKDFNEGNLPFIDDIEGALGKDRSEITNNEVAKAIRSSFSPTDIVNSAEAFDNITWHNWLADRTGVEFVKVKNGAVALDKTSVKGIRIQKLSESISLGRFVLPKDKIIKWIFYRGRKIPIRAKAMGMIKKGSFASSKRLLTRMKLNRAEQQLDENITEYLAYKNRGLLSWNKRILRTELGMRHMPSMIPGNRKRTINEIIKEIKRLKGLSGNKKVTYDTMGNAVYRIQTQNLGHEANRITLPNGSRILVKKARDFNPHYDIIDPSHSEDLFYKLGKKLGLDDVIPAAKKGVDYRGDTVVYQTYIDNKKDLNKMFDEVDDFYRRYGPQWKNHPKLKARYTDPETEKRKIMDTMLNHPKAKMAGTLDYVVGMKDRHSGNILLDITGRKFTLIDNESIFGSKYAITMATGKNDKLLSPFAERLYVDGDRINLDNFRKVRRALEDLKPEFDAIQNGDKAYKEAMARIDYVLKNKKVDPNMYDLDRLKEADRYITFNESIELSVRDIVKWITVHGKRIHIRVRNPVIGGTKFARFRMQRGSNWLKNILKKNMVVMQEDIGTGINGAQIWKMSDGTELIYKKPFNSYMGADNEVLAHDIANLMGLGDNAPATIKLKDIGDRLDVLQKRILGAKNTLELFNELPTPQPYSARRALVDNHIDDMTKIVKSKTGRKIGIFDYIISNTDRNPGNWMLKGEKVHLIDHEFSFGSSIGQTKVRSPFARNLINSRLTNNEIRYLKVLKRKIERSRHLFSEDQQYKEVMKRINYLQVYGKPDANKVSTHFWDDANDKIMI